MKTSPVFIGLLLLSVARCIAADPMSQALQKGLLAEEASQNPQAAIEAYQSVLNQFEEQRRVAATAAFRLGECYRKLGRTNEAVAQFERVLRDFASEGNLAAMSRKYLTEAGRIPSVGNAETQSGTDLTPIFDPAQTELLKQEIALIEQQVAETEKRFQSGRAQNLDVLQLKRQLYPLLRKLPENTSPERQKELVQEEMELVRQMLDVTRSMINAGRAEPAASLALDRDLLDLHRQSLGLSQTSFQTRLNSVVARALTEEEAKEIQRIQDLIKNSPDLINARREDNATELFLAAQKGQLAVAGFLLDNNADVNAGIGSGAGAPLHAAAIAGNKSMVELLLGRGAIVNATDSDGETPLHMAAARGYQAVSQVLLEKGADVNARDTARGFTPLRRAVAGNHRGLIELLLANKADVNAADVHGETSLFTAVQTGREALVKLLLDHGADVQAKAREGRTPLTVAVRQRSYEIIELLLASGASPNVATKFDIGSGGSFSGSFSDWTPLHYAAYVGDTRMVELLLKHGADIDPQDSNARTPLACAVLQLKAPAVELLAAKGANPNLKDRDGQTPFTLLLPDFVKTAFERAMASPSRSAVSPTPEGQRIFQSLVAHGASLKDATPAAAGPIIEATFNGNTHLVGLLLDIGAELNVKSVYGFAPLHVAAANGQTNMLELLLSKGADVNVQDDFGNTPLHYAVFNERKAAVETLVAHRAKTDIRNVEDRPPARMVKDPSVGISYQYGIPVKQKRPVFGGRPDLIGVHPQTLTREQQEIQDLLEPSQAPADPAPVK